MLATYPGATVIVLNRGEASFLVSRALDDDASIEQAAAQLLEKFKCPAVIITRGENLVGTHYDSIARAYRDKKNPDGFMPGANNSASGVATLLELARVLKDTTSSSSAVGVDLVFFDGEEGELALGAGDQNWSPLGSTYFASKLATLYPDTLPHTGIILDMVCDRDLSLSPEKISIDFASTRVKSFWEIGATIAPKVFATNITNSIGDDHVALNTAGIPSFLVIDLQYEPWFNTTLDTPDKCSAESLAAVGRTVETYIKTR
jgi:Zn-dependent M28 family amino/carboxypeptidase